MDQIIVIKLLKFVAVGFSGLFVDFGITYVFKEFLKVQKYLANAIGFMCAASTNYVLNRIWTFESHNPAVFNEYSRFILVAAIGLGINTLVLWFLVSKLKWNFYLSKLFAIAVVTVWNFTINLLFTFS